MRTRRSQIARSAWCHFQERVWHLSQIHQFPRRRPNAVIGSQLRIRPDIICAFEKFSAVKVEAADTFEIVTAVTDGTPRATRNSSTGTHQRSPRKSHLVHSMPTSGRWEAVERPMGGRCGHVFQEPVFIDSRAGTGLPGGRVVAVEQDGFLAGLQPQPVEQDLGSRGGREQAKPRPLRGSSTS